MLNIPELWARKCKICDKFSVSCINFQKFRRSCGENQYSSKILSQFQNLINCVNVVLQVKQKLFHREVVTLIFLHNFTIRAGNRERKPQKYVSIAL